MGKPTLREIIRETEYKHLEDNNGMLFGECVRDPGGVSNTIPNHPSVIDMPMSETAAAHFAIGASLAGRRSIFVVRFQNFMLLGASPFISYASVVKDIYGKSAPVFIRAVGSDYHDCNHSDMLHSLLMHFPGIRVCAPMTSGEWLDAWNTYMSEEQPLFCSEYRDAYDETDEYQDEICNDADINLFGISKARHNIIEAKKILKDKGIKANIFHIAWLKPFNAEKYANIMSQVPLGLVVDAGRVICGAPEHIAYELMTQAPESMVYAYGVEDVPKSLNPKYHNEVPGAQKIADKVINILSRNGGLK